MKLWMLLERRLLMTVAASAAMLALIDKQQDLTSTTADAVLQQHYKTTAKMAVGFAEALWDELSTSSYS